VEPHSGILARPARRTPACPLKYSCARPQLSRRRRGRAPHRAAHRGQQRGIQVGRLRAGPHRVRHRADHQRGVLGQPAAGGGPQPGDQPRLRPPRAVRPTADFRRLATAAAGGAGPSLPGRQTARHPHRRVGRRARRLPATLGHHAPPAALVPGARSYPAGPARAEVRACRGRPEIREQRSSSTNSKTST
jgi:hypothetical protein